MADVFHGAVAVHGWRELQRLLAKTDKESRKQIRVVEREIAEPVKVVAESFALTRISHIDKRWWRMRIGLTQRFLYVAPRQRGIKIKGSHPLKRPAFAPLLYGTAMLPAAERFQPEFEQRLERAFEQIARTWGEV
jgi:hypothetical protein